MLLIIVLSSLTTVYSEIKNSLNGMPTVTCGDDFITMTIETSGPFEGNIYTSGFFEQPSCRLQGWMTHKSSSELRIPVGPECGTRRHRMMAPRGILLEVTVIVMFHRLFLTKIDKSYHIECFYVQYDREVSQSYDVSVPPPIDLHSTNLNEEGASRIEEAAPICKYEVLQGGPTGPALKYAKLGDTVYHKWACSSSSSDLCMTVHSCVVDDGRGNGQQLIDERGCTMDAFLIDNLVYSSHMEIMKMRECGQSGDFQSSWDCAINNPIASQTAQVFRFADRSPVFFSCQIRLEKVEHTEDGCSHDFSFCSIPIESNNDNVEVSTREGGGIEDDFPRPSQITIGNTDSEQSQKEEEESNGQYYEDMAQEVPRVDDIQVLPRGRRRSRHRMRMLKQAKHIPYSDTLEKPPLRLVDLIEPGTSMYKHRVRRDRSSDSTRSPLTPSFDIDVSAPSIDVSDEPLYENPEPRSLDDIRIDTNTGEVCMSALSFAMFLLSIVLMISIVSLIYWIHAFKKTGRMNKFIENYWIDVDAPSWRNRFSLY